MKKLFHLVLILCLVYACGHGLRQDMPNINIFDSKYVHRLDGPERFAAFHQAIRTGEGKEFPDYEEGYRLKALFEAQSRSAIEKRNAPLPWMERGPSNVGGRTRGLWVDPKDSTAETVFAGSVGGGIWKTEDAGKTWRNLTPDLPTLSTATIAGSPANTAVLYAGTGEGFGSFHNILGDGMWKSIDNGESWSQLSATAGRDAISAIYRIIVNPEDENQLFFATLANPRLVTTDLTVSNIYMSTDGGSSINSIYSSENEIQQIVADPNNFDLMYATLYGSSIIRSTNRGSTWETVYQTDTFLRMELAISPSNPKHIFVTAQVDPPENAANQNTSHLIYSPDGGQQWYEVKPINGANDFGDWFGGQGWYDNTLAVHPYDSTTIFVGGAGAILQIKLDRFDTSTNQYLATMLPVTDGYAEYRENYPNASTKGVHVDHHHIVLIPRNASTKSFYMLDANDGGVAFSMDGGTSFIQTGDLFSEECLNFDCSQTKLHSSATGYNTSQFYGVDKQNGQARYVAGTQDNGSWVSPTNPMVDSKWNSAPSGDGFESVWHYEKTNQLIESSQFNNLYRSDDGGQSWRFLTLPGDGPFLTRLAGSQQDPDLLFGVTEQGVIKSFDFGEHWQTIQMPDQWRFHGVANPIRISLANPNIVWSGAGLRENSQVTVSKDGGTSFELVSTYAGANLGLMTNLTTHPLEEQTAYFLFSQANGPKIIRTTNLGATLEDITGFVSNKKESTNGFPNVATYCLLVMPYDDQVLWAGTDIGLFESLNGGKSWALANNGLPNVAIWEMKIVNDEVILATHGRGIWTVVLPELAAYEPIAVDFLAPQLLLDGPLFAGTISGEIHLRSEADSSILSLEYPKNGETNKMEIRIPANRAGEVVTIDQNIGGIIGDEFIEVTASISCFFGEEILRSSATALIHAVDTIPITSYFTDFDDGLRDFARLDWTIENPMGFNNLSLNTPHPYLDQDAPLAIFKQPILISPVTTEVQFDEIVLVEPGESDAFPSEDFFDYCQVDATADFGKTWMNLAAYDSRDDANWLRAFNQDPNSATPSLYAHRIIELNDFFNEGETVYLRFRLVSDPALTGWGWNIDNFLVGSDVVPVFETPDIGLEFRLLRNPVTEVLSIEWENIHQNITLECSIVSLNGQLSKNKIIQLSPGVRRLTSMDVSDLPPGSYFLIVRVENHLRTIKWIKL